MDLIARVTTISFSAIILALAFCIVIVLIRGAIDTVFGRRMKPVGSMQINASDLTEEEKEYMDKLIRKLVEREEEK